MTGQPTCSDCGQAAKHAALNLCHRCRRLGIRRDSLRTALARHGRGDLVEVLIRRRKAA